VNIGHVPKNEKERKIMKKLIASVLLGAMLVGGAGSAFAEDSAAATELVLAESSHLVLDREAGYVDKIDGTVTVADLKANFAGAVSVAGKDGVAKADDAVVATDDAVVAGEDVLKALIYGDVNRDGKVNLGDVSSILKQIAKWETETSQLAADVNKDEKVNLADVSKMLKKIAKWDDISLGNVRLVYENKALTAENEDDTLDLFFSDMMLKTIAEDTEHTGEYAHKMKLAKNETESCQAYLYSENNREGLSAEITDFVSEYGDATMKAELEWVKYYGNAISYPIIKNDRTRETGKWQNSDEYVDWYHGDIPEVLLDMADTFELEGQRTQHFVITAKSTKDTPAGMYTATFSVKDGDKVIKTGTIYAYVWDFTLPDAPYSASLFATAQYAYDEEKGEWDRKDYYDMLLDNNISGYNLPYAITDPRADAYMNDPRVSAFVIAGGGHWYGDNMYGGSMDRTDQETIDYYNKVMSNPEWAKKGLFYYTDEPYGNRLDNVKMTYERVTELLGTTNIRNITPLAGNDGYGSDYCQTNEVDPVAYIDPYINVWCPQSGAFHLSTEGGKWTPRRWLNKFGEFADRAKAFKERGEEMWWYVCCAPEIPYANYFTWYQGAVVRVLSWQQYYNDVDGVLYYGIGVHWDKISKHQFEIYNGDGVLAFPGEFWGRTGPQESWRLYQIRDGFDDIDYLSMAEELVGRDEVMKVVRKVTTGMLRYTEDHNVINAARDEIVKIILENQAK